MNAKMQTSDLSWIQRAAKEVASLGIRAAVVAFLVAGGVWGLRYLAWCDDRGLTTLYPLAGSVDALLLVGVAIATAWRDHAWTISAVIAAAGILASCLMAWLGRTSWRSSGQVVAVIVFGTLALLGFTTQKYSLAIPCAVAGGLALVAAPVDDARRLLLGYRRLFVLFPLGVALVLRFFALAEYPKGFAGHAVGHLKTSIRFYEALLPRIVAGEPGAWSSVGDEMLGFLGPNALVEAFGFSVYGVSMVTARLMPALLGFLTVPAAYFLGKSLWDYRLGLILALLLAVSPWNVSVSRYADTEHVMAPLQMLLALGFLFKASDLGRLRDYLLAAVCLSASWYIYATNQIVPLIATAFLLYKIVFVRSFLRRHWWRLVVFVLVFGALSYPQLHHHFDDGQYIPIRTSYRTDPIYGFISPSQVVEHVKLALGQLFVQVNDPWFGKPGGGLGAVEATLLLPGFIWCLSALRSRRWRDAAVLMSLWLSISVLPGVLAQEVPFRRLYLLGLGALVLAAIVLLRIYELLQSNGFPKSFRILLAGTLSLLYVALNAHVYFDRVRVGESVYHRQHQAVADLVARRLGQEYLYVYAPDLEAVGVFRDYIELFAYKDLQAARRRGGPDDELYGLVVADNLEEALASPKQVDGRTRFLAEQYLTKREVNGVTIRDRLKVAFPTCIEEEHKDVLGGVSFHSWLVERGTESQRIQVLSEGTSMR